ncbi:hypothetical protein EMCRGX_G022967 [Ephydatia muelleri]
MSVECCLLVWTSCLVIHRVVQKNLVFVIGLSPRLADAETLKKPEYFGKYGKIYKVVINNSTVYNGAQHQLYETATLGATNTVQGEASAATLGMAMGVAMGVANTAMGVANATLTVANVTLGGANNTLVPKELKRSSSHPTTTSRESSLCESVESNGTSLEGWGRREHIHRGGIAINDADECPVQREGLSTPLGAKSSRHHHHRHHKQQGHKQ